MGNIRGYIKAVVGGALPVAMAAALLIIAFNTPHDNTAAANAESLSAESITVACVGDSITYGSGVINSRDTESFEAYLETLLPVGSKALNFGVPGATLQSSGDFPYRDESAFTESLRADADVYILMLGTNDAKSINWNPDNYKSELMAFISIYTDIVGYENVLYMLPPHSFYSAVNAYSELSVIEDNLDEEITIIKATAEELGVNTIDLYALTEGHREWFPDGLHPNAEGNYAIAEEIFGELKKYYSVSEK